MAWCCTQLFLDVYSIFNFTISSTYKQHKVNEMGWEDQEMEALNIGDERLNKREVNIVGRLFESLGSSFTQCFKSRSELVAAYRFLDNNRATPQKVLASHYEHTKSRIIGGQYPVVLCPNDTSSIDFSGRPGTEGLGILESSFAYGVLIHPTLAITPENICLGCLNVKMWERDPDAKRKSLPSEVRNNQPIEEKESIRWIESFRVVNEIAKEIPGTQFIHTGDRESDMLEYLFEAAQARENEHGAFAIVRVNHNRQLMSKTDTKRKTKEKKTKKAQIEEIETELEPEEELKLKKAMLSAPVMGEVTFMMPGRNGKPARKVMQKIRARTVSLKGKKVGGRNYPSIEINVVCSIEEAPPSGEKAICWIFFTTLPIDTAEQVHNIIKYYLSRWQIEVLFHVFKTGCKVEEKELRTADRIKNMLALYLIVAWRVMYIMTVSRERPEISCTELFEEAEWKSVYKVIHKGSRIPTKPISLGEFVSLIAKLGGYLSRKDSPPGPKVIWLGLRRTYDFALAWESFGGEK
jgi:hypothetical protein